MASPRVIVPSKLKLTRAQEDALMEHVSKRFKELRTEMGWLSDGQYDAKSFLEERRRAWAEYDGDFDHRKNDIERYGPIFKDYSDSSLNIPRRAVDTFTARGCESLLNSQPFASLAPEGEEDQNKAMPLPGMPPPPDPVKLLDRFWNRKLADADAMYRFRDGIRGAAVANETVFKITKCLADEQDDEGEEKQIWLDPSGEPLRDSRNRYVFADDEFEPDPQALEGEILKRDPVVIKMPGAVLSEETFPAEPKQPKMVLDIRDLDYRNFICSPTAADIHKTDYIAHTFDYDLDELWKLTTNIKLSPEAKAWRETVKAGNTQAKTDSSRPNERTGEKERGESAPVVLQLAESWLRYDARQRGQCDEIAVLWDVATGYPVEYSLRKDKSVTGKRPFEVVVVKPVKNRWYGSGFYRKLANESTYVDRQIARLDMRTSTSGRITFYRKGTLEEVDTGADIVANGPTVYTATSNLQKGDKPVEHIELEPMDQSIWRLVEMRIQQAALTTGTITTGEAAAADLEQSETLGGQEMVAEESALMSDDITQDVRRGIEATLKQSILAIMSDFDPEEARQLLGVENGDVLAEWVASHDPKSVLHYVRLLMTKSKSKLQMVANNQAIEAIAGGKSWMDILAMIAAGQLPPDFADKVRPLYRGILDANDIEGAEEIMKLQPPVPSQPGVAQPPGAPPLATVPPAPGQPQAPPSALPVTQQPIQNAA